MQEVDRRPSSSEQPLDRSVLRAEYEERRKTRDGEEAEPVRVLAELRFGEEGCQDEGGDEEDAEEFAEAEREIWSGGVAGRRVGCSGAGDRGKTVEEGGKGNGEA